MVCVLYNQQQVETPQLLRLTSCFFNHPCISVQKIVTEQLLPLPRPFFLVIFLSLFLFFFPFFCHCSDACGQEDAASPCHTHTHLRENKDKTGLDSPPFSQRYKKSTVLVSPKFYRNVCEVTIWPCSQEI